MFWILLLTCAIPSVALQQFSLHTYCDTKLNMNQRTRGFDGTGGTKHPPIVRPFHVRTITHSITQHILSLKQRKPKTRQDYFQSPSLNTILSQFNPPSPHNIYRRSHLSPSLSHRRMFRERNTNQTVTWCKTESGFEISLSQLTVKVSFLLYDHKLGYVFRKSRLQSDRHYVFLMSLFYALSFWPIYKRQQIKITLLTAFTKGKELQAVRFLGHVLRWL